ncbi:Flp pilus assembly protein CpaB [Sphingomonas sp. RB56-2]|uniref:Flp pilus assembly protein CpaB n=1 Tax=Sphingomonas brevis TaxID=2908206 RepID=A0ABT0S732_9SPHN|nr:Flp pilus assembly protein CpaB [Sphingomonas brevis]MCL6739949.1 Flp pilus assembly protein CpaB [Sphingomonas brevis]
MDVKKVALLVGALVIAVVTAIMAKNMFAGAGADQANAAPVVPAGPKVLVARKALPVGTIIDAESLTFQAWPKELVQNAYYTEGAPEADVQKLLGTVVRNPITAGQPLTKGALVGPNDRGFLAAALGPGMRAITVPVSNTTGVAGFIFPGDRVDMMLTQDVAGGGDGPPLKVSETVIRNLRVLATDQRTDSKDEEGKTIVKTFNTVTLEVTPRIAEKIAVAQSLGSLSLSLRSIADNTAELERAVASGEVKVPAGTNPVEERQMLLAVANRPADNNTTFVTGGDVSRFQRRSIPAKPSDSSGNATNNSANASGGAVAGTSVPVGPVVRVARGNSVTVVPVGAR